MGHNPNNAVQPSPYVAVIVNGIKNQFNFTGSNKLFKNTNNNAALFFGLSYPTYENKVRYFNGAMDEIHVGVQGHLGNWLVCAHIAVCCLVLKVV